ncbi:hypothetical protein PEC18_12090 [Paucibacter sp. O1-1]|nr:hypothetical protein [Paucibacter sp. O1-1]MDA3826556.1 hypothetical protein [Paucibacter sp. O1-1]
MDEEQQTSLIEGYGGRWFQRRVLGLGPYIGSYRLYTAVPSGFPDVSRLLQGDWVNLETKHPTPADAEADALRAAQEAIATA